MLIPTASLAVLKNRDFRFLLGTRLTLVAALQAQAVIVGWQIYELTDHLPPKTRYLMMGYTGLAEAIPALSCALFAGHLVDSGRPHAVFLRCVAIMLLNAIMLLLAAGHVIPAERTTLLTILYGGVFISGMARSFIMPSSFSLLSAIVPRDEIPAASAWLSSGFQLAAILGPTIVGILYGQKGPFGAWLLLVLLMASGLACLLLMSRPVWTHRNSGLKREPAAKSIAEGFRFLWSSPVLLSLMALDMLAVLLGGAIAMLPAYADEILHVGSEGLGALRAAPAVGAVLTALWLAVRPLPIIRGATMLWVVAGFGVAIIGFGVSQLFWLSLIFLALSGVFDSVSVVIRSTLVQLLTPDHMRGRISSVNSMFIISSNELGAFWSGASARLLGLTTSVVVGGIGTLLVAGITAWKSPLLRGTEVDTHAKQPGVA